VKIGMLMLRHPKTRKSPIMPEVVRLLREWGATVDVIYPEERVADLAAVGIEHDLYVLKSGSELALSMAGALHAAGANILNPFPIAAVMRDKIAATRVLQAAGVPVPTTYVSSHARKFAPLLEEGPLVLKPHRGSQGRGVRVVWDADELDDAPGETSPVFAQRYHKPEGEDRKIYCIGGQLFGVLRVWPAKSYEEKLGKPFTITPELRDIALRCGKAFGVELFGLDIIISDGRPYVVDIQSFPGFKGVPDPALRLADYVYTAAQRALTGEPLLPGAGASVPWPMVREAGA
jgi:ribosomal protein S6--L-glutamate ligase